MAQNRTLHFTKMHGCGNDYIYINGFDTAIDAPEALSVRLSDRHTGVGGDGLVLILPADLPNEAVMPATVTAADAKMRMFNADGSEGKMCGNAIRCVAKYLYDNGLVANRHMHIDTLSGIKTVQVFTHEGIVTAACVDMGKAELAPEQIPAILAGPHIVARPITVGGATYAITCISMGNPHAVIFCEKVDALDLQTIGPLFEYHPVFPDRVNTEFVERLGKNHLKMRVWERGSGETQACGTGACASAVAAVLNGICDKNADITVQLRGGALTVRYTDAAVLMTGACEKVFDGTVIV